LTKMRVADDKTPIDFTPADFTSIDFSSMNFSSTDVTIRINISVAFNPLITMPNSIYTLYNPI